MSEQRLKRVRQAEIAAEKARKQADEDAAAIVSNGNKEARNLLDSAEKEAKADYDAKLARADSKAEADFRERVDKEQRVCDNIKSHAHVSMNEAVDLIVGKVMGSNGNS